MMKRTRYTVRIHNQIARFSSLTHAQLFAATVSNRLPDYLIEVNAKDGLAGQYQNGQPTQEFLLHHIPAGAP